MPELIESSRHPIFTDVVQKLERLLIYASIAVLLVTEAISPIVPLAGKFLDSGGIFVLIGIMLFGFFRFLDERLPTEESGFAVTESFADAVSHALGPGKAIDELDIFAFTTSKYSEFVPDKDIRVRSLRIIVSSTESVQLSGGGELSAAIRNWQNRKADGLIGLLEVRRSTFDPRYHFMIVDGKRMMFGFFRSTVGHSQGRLPMNNLYLFTSEGAHGERFVDDSMRFFEMVFRDYSQKIEIADR